MVRVVIVAVVAATISRAIRVYAAARGITITDLERALAMSHQSFYKRLSGDVDWRIDELRVVAERLAVTVPDLLTDPLARAS